MKKAELGKDSEAIANITQDQDEKGPKVDEEEPLVQEPETVDGGENPGVPQELKNSANKTEESEEQVAEEYLEAHDQHLRDQVLLRKLRLGRVRHRS